MICSNLCSTVLPHHDHINSPILWAGLSRISLIFSYLRYYFETVHFKLGAFKFASITACLSKVLRDW